MDGSICKCFSCKCQRGNSVLWYIVSSFDKATSSPTKWFFFLKFRINAPGPLRVPFVPNELNDFAGPKMHTAEWNHDIDLKGKKVAVIGSGASAVQVIPSIVDSVDTLHCYQRKPPYVLPRPQFAFPNFMKSIFKYLPFVMWLYRCAIYLLHELIYSAFRPDSIFHMLGE